MNTLSRPGASATSATGAAHSDQPDGQDRRTVRRARRPLGVQRVVGDQRRRAVVRPAVRSSIEVERRDPPVRQPAQNGRGADDDRERHAEHGEREERRDRQADQQRVVQRSRPTRTTAWATIARTAAPSPANSAVTDGRVAEADVERGQREQRDHAGQHEQDPGDQAAAQRR